MQFRLIGLGAVVTVVAAMATVSTGCMGSSDAESQPGSRELGAESEALKSCSAAIDCHTGRYCARPAGDCSGSGTCQAMPDECLDIDAPVCGCDGVTYSNSCFAAMMGVTVKFEGVCETPCTSNAECGKAYCSKPAGQCGGKGICKVRPEACTDIYNPVCGCDGVTYPNDCFAAMAGQDVASSGACL